MTEIESLEEDQEVYLRDNLTGDYFELTTMEVYSFNSDKGSLIIDLKLFFKMKPQT